MKKYMFVIPSLSKGGAERVVSILASELVKQNREAVILIYHKTMQDYEVDKRVKVICLSGGYEEDYDRIGRLKRLAMMRSIICKEKPDYLLPFITHVCLQTWAARLFSGIDVIFTIRVNPATGLLPKPVSLLRKYLVEHSRLTIVQNEEQRNYFNEKSRDKIKILPNPIQTEYLNLPVHITDERRKVIIGAGRLSVQKNFSLLIKSLHRLSVERSDFIAYIYGEGVLKEQLQAEIDGYGLRESIVLKGRTADMKQVYSDADVFVLSSDYEGMPNALMEAMASGMACVSTDCPTGPKDLIDDGVNGFLTPVNDVDAMTNAIEKLLDDSALRSSFSNAARATISERYLPDKIVKSLINICEDV